jgi:hypothetical protein
VCVYIYIYTYTYIHTYIYTYICVCVCVYIYMYVYMYIYIHIYTSGERLRKSGRQLDGTLWSSDLGRARDTAKEIVTELVRER